MLTRPGEVITEAQSQVYGAEDLLQIGECRYRSLEAVIAYDTPDGYIEGLLWLPELGFAILDWTQTGAEDRIDIVPLAISRGK